MTSDMDKTETGDWTYSDNEERWSCHHVDLLSREAAIAEALGCLELEPGQEFWIGRARLKSEDEVVRFLFGNIEEEMVDSYMDEMSDEAPDLNATKRQIDELIATLRATTRDWMVKHDVLPRWYMVEHVERMNAPDESKAASLPA